MSSGIGDVATALLIGLLLGLERERAHGGRVELFAGIRTFPMLTLGGYLAAATGERFVLVAFVAAVAGLAIAAYVRAPRRETGATTEVVAMSAPVLGALVQHGAAPLAAAAAVVITLLLTLKAPLHKLAWHVSQEEILAIVKFAIVAVVLLPMLPSTPVGPYGAVVPRQVGFVVLVLSGVSLGGYLLVRVLGNRSGWALAGALGGLVSSTALTLSFSQKAREESGLARALAVGVMLASTVVYVRGLLLIAFFDRALAAHLAPRLLALFVVSLAFAALKYRRGAGEEGRAASLGNPVELGRAFALALIFTAILIAARAAQEELGTRGLWATGLVGGFVDVDSVAVAAARLRRQDLAPLGGAAGAFLLATLSNLCLKGGIVAAVGRGPLAREVLPAFGVVAALTAVMLFV